jgi:hypothetical protein
MLAHDRVVFAEGHFFRRVARVFLGDIEKAGVSGAEQLDFDSGWLRHGPFLWFEYDCKKQAAMLPHRSQLRAFAGVSLQSQVPVA